MFECVELALHSHRGTEHVYLNIHDAWCGVCFLPAVNQPDLVGFFSTRDLDHISADSPTHKFCRSFLPTPLLPPARTISPTHSRSATFSFRPRIFPTPSDLFLSPHQYSFPQPSSSPIIALLRSCWRLYNHSPPSRPDNGQPFLCSQSGLDRPIRHPQREYLAPSLGQFPASTTSSH